ncbi:hypothetical protein TNCV_1425651 [Trichonephila clavipes]|nr:hypothetical protein TNCV_1425651 [Trichonephila clavipes]
MVRKSRLERRGFDSWCHLRPTVQKRLMEVKSVVPQCPSVRKCEVNISLTVVFSIADYPRVIPEPEVTRRLAKHRYSQLRIEPNPRIIHPKLQHAFNLLRATDAYKRLVKPKLLLPRTYIYVFPKVIAPHNLRNAGTRASGRGTHNAEPWSWSGWLLRAGTPLKTSMPRHCDDFEPRQI